MGLNRNGHRRRHIRQEAGRPGRNRADLLAGGRQDRMSNLQTNSLRERILDALMDGPSTIAELACWMNEPTKRVDTSMSRLHEEGLVVVKDTIRSHYGRQERLFDMARTKKAAAG